MGKFTTQNEINYNNTLTAIAKYLSDYYQISYSYEMYYSDMISEELLTFIIKEDDTGNEIISVNKKLNPKSSTYYFNHHNYLGSSTEFNEDFKLLMQITGIKEFLDTLINKHNESKDSIEEIVKKVMHPTSIKLDSIFTFDNDKNVSKINKDKFFEFLAEFLSNMENKEIKFEKTRETKVSYSAVSMKQENKVFETYSLTSPNGTLYTSKDLDESFNYSYGLDKGSINGLNEYISKDDALKITSDLEKKYPYMIYLKEIIRTYKQPTDYTIETLTSLVKKQYYYFD